MSTYAEDQNPNIWEKLRRWKSSIAWLNTRIPQTFIFPLFTLCLGARYGNGWGGHAGFGKADTDSLFYNGAFFIRIMLPFFIGIQIRWAGTNPDAREYLQSYIGVKLNGEWAVVPRFRIQSDNSAANGTSGANSGQAVGWNAGTK